MIEIIVMEEKEYFPLGQLAEIEKIIVACYNRTLKQRLLDFQTLSTTDRYLKLIKTTPYLIQQASITQVASYLGVKLETLSRIRMKIIHPEF